MSKTKITEMSNEAEMTLTKDDFVDLYNQAQSCENAIRTASRNSTSIFSSLLLAVIGGGFALVRFVLPERVMAGCLMICIGLALCGLSVVAYKHFVSDFRRQVEYMSIQAKIEDILGLSDAKKYHAQQYWSDEPVVPKSYVDFRNDKRNCASTSDFINNMLKGKSVKMIGYYGIFVAIGLAFIVAAILVFVGVIDVGAFAGSKE